MQPVFHGLCQLRTLLSLLRSFGGCVCRYAIKKKDELERVAKANR